jgi:hypothetical protein
VRTSIVNLLSLTLLGALAAGACDSQTLPCVGGCPVGQVCDVAAGRCIELRPPEPPPDLGRFNSVAVDSAGRLVVASYAARYGDLVLGRQRDSGGYDWEYVDGLPSVGDPGLRRDPVPIVPGPDVGLYASLRLDALDRPHLAYFDRTLGRLKYAVRTGEGWQIEQVPQLGDGDHIVGRGASLVLGADGLPRIGFLDEQVGGVMLATKLPGERWSIEQVSACAPEQDWPGPPGVETGRLVSLVLDKRGSEWIGFQDLCSASLLLASRKPEGWAILELDPGPQAGNWVSAALDASGNVAVAYHDRSEGALAYAWNQAGTMKTVVVDQGLEIEAQGAQRRWPVGQHCALAFGQDGLARVVYLDSRGLDLKLVTGLPTGGFAEPVVLLSDGAVGLFNAIARSPEDLAVVTYRVGRDEQGASDGVLLDLKVDGGAQRLGGAP